jgi:aminocarboxymuconate-semialdehyde decarboxylase
MATVPLQHPDAAIAEMERVVRDYGFKAIEIGTSVEGVLLAEAKFRPVLRRAQELGLFVFAHPYYVGAKGGLESYYLTNLIGNPLDTTTMLAHLMYSGALDELPDLKICLAHGGGFAPYQIGRLVHGHKVRAEAHEFSKTSPKELLRRFYFDSLVFDPQALRYLIDLVGADHVCIGTDAPFDMGDDHPEETISAVPRLTEDEHHEVCCGTALRLLGEGSSGF